MPLGMRTKNEHLSKNDVLFMSIANKVLAGAAVPFVAATPGVSSSA